MSDLRLAVPAATAWITALACTQNRSVLVGVPVILGVVALVLLGVAPLVPFRRVLATLAVCAALSASVATVTVLALEQSSPPLIERYASSDGVVRVDVEVTGRAVPLAGPSDRVVVDVTLRAATTADGTASGLAVPAVLFLDSGAGESHATRIGDRIALTARIEHGRPGDREAFVLADVGGEATVTAAPAVVDAAGAVRAAFVDLARGLPGDGGRLLPGLAVGDTSLVDDALDDRMTGASLGHLTAVSGANCALVVGTVLGALALVGASRAIRVGVSLACLAGFVVLVTPEPSVVRAAVMAAIVLVTHGLGRASLGGPVLFLAVVVCLLLDPWLAREFGFALSVAATAGLLFLAGPLTTLLSRVMPPVIAAAVALPLAAQLACQPVIVLLDPSIPVWGIPANMLAAPAAPVVTILGMASCLLLPALPGLATVVAWLAWVPSQWIAGVAAATDDAPFARLPGAPGLLGVSAALGLLVVVAVLAAARTKITRRIAATVLVVALCGALAVVGGARIGQLWSRPPDWDVAMCDVGQGDAVLVRSDDRVALIDTGPDPDALERCLDDLGIARVDLLVLSHFDADHVGGLDAVTGRTDVVLHQPLREDADRALIAGMAAGGARTSPTTAGVTGALGSIPWRILWPPPEPSPYTANDGSVVVEFGGAVDAIFLGDLGADSELALLAEGTVGTDYAIVKFAHHGSADQYGPLYERIHARLALVSCGIDNDYGHPTATALSLLREDGTAVARSDREGTTLVAARDDRLETWSSGAGPP